MLNIIGSEIYKMKRNRVFLVCALVTMAMPVLLILKDLNSTTSVIAHLSIDEWALSSIQMSILLLLPVLSGFVITTIMQREYTEHTIINTMTAPVSRIGFITGKIAAWFIWHLLVSMICWLIILFGAMLFYTNALDSGEKLLFAFNTLITCVKISIYGFLALMPVLCVAIAQRRLFYPSLLTCLFLTFLTAYASQMPEWLAIKLPWTAVTVQLLMDNPPQYSLIPIFICGIASFITACVCIYKQDL